MGKRFAENERARADVEKRFYWEKRTMYEFVRDWFGDEYRGCLYEVDKEADKKEQNSFGGRPIDW